MVIRKDGGGSNVDRAGKVMKKGLNKTKRIGMGMTSSDIHTSPEAANKSDHTQVADDTSLRPAKRVLQLILDTLQRRDSHELFAEPVDPAQVEDYYEIIRDPMDFGTMRAKLHEDMYQFLHQFEHDVYSIFRNAMHFNSSGSSYFKQARALDDMAKKVFHAFKTDPQKFELEFATTKRRSTRKICSDDRDSNMGSCTKLLMDKRSCGERKSVVTRDGRATYKPLTSLHGVREPDGPALTTMYAGSTPLLQASQQEIGYRESLMAFVKDLGPTAKRVAQRKMQDSRASKHNDFISIPPSNKKTKDDASCSQRAERAKRSNDTARKLMNKKIVLAVPAAPRARGGGCANRAHVTRPLASSSTACKPTKTTTRTKKATAKHRRSTAPKISHSSACSPHESMNIVEKAPKKTKTEVSAKSAAEKKRGNTNPNDDMRQKRVKGSMIAPPSWQLNRLDLNEDASLSGPTTSMQPTRNPWQLAGEKDIKVYGPSMATNMISGTAGCSYYQYQGWQGSAGSSSSNMGREFYFDLSYLRSRLHGASSMQSPGVGAVQPYVHKQLGAYNSMWPCLPNSKSGT